MKRFISTRFVSALQKTSQKGISIDAQVLQNSYDEFVMLLFQEAALHQNKAAYRNALVYTRVELAGLPKVSGKKCCHLPLQSHRID